MAINICELPGGVGTLVRAICSYKEGTGAKPATGVAPYLWLILNQISSDYRIRIQ